METGIELIAKERKEQIEKHGRTIDFDAKVNDDGQLAQAAIFVLTHEASDYPKTWDAWFYDKVRLKPQTIQSDIELLSIAGALIAAEIDRLQTTEV